MFDVRAQVHLISEAGRKDRLNGVLCQCAPTLGEAPCVLRVWSAEEHFPGVLSKRTEVRVDNLYGGHPRSSIYAHLSHGPRNPGDDKRSAWVLPRSKPVRSGAFNEGHASIKGVTVEGD